MQDEYIFIVFQTAYSAQAEPQTAITRRTSRNSTSPGSAHACQKLKAYSHLKGHLGTAWQNQQKEFANLPAPILFATNSIMPVRDSYRDRVFTTCMVQYPGMVLIAENKESTTSIDAAVRTVPGHGSAVSPKNVFLPAMPFG